MKHIFIGSSGSIATRHIRNLKLLRPDASIVTVDIDGKADYTDYRKVDFTDTIAYICTPMELHCDQLEYVYYEDARAIFVEKPLYGARDSTYITSEIIHEDGVPIVCGYNYRHNPLFQSLKSRADSIAYLHFYGSEDLSPKYGPTALGTMASHSIDMALWLLGDPEHCQVADYGAHCFVGIRHKNKASCNITASMHSPFRVASVTAVFASESDKDMLYRNGKSDHDLKWEHYFVEPNDEMYLSEMNQWLEYVEGGSIGNLCGFSEALKVQQVMSGNSK